ncbi:MAG: fimbria/pilus periplasmic chaperone [bacterium]|nr:fimbria/pilus periplasmic chaperone [bacterium]
MRHCLIAGLLAWTLLAWTLAAAAQVPPQFGVSPGVFDFGIDSRRSSTHSFRASNYSEKPMEVRITIHNWDLDEDNKTRLLPPTEQSLDQWLVINPVHFIIPPKGSQVVRFSVRPRVRPEPGEHRAMIYLTQIPPEEKERTLRITFRVGVAVYAQVGEVVRKGTLHGVEIDREEVFFDISSSGTANVRMLGQYAFWRAAAYPGVDRTEPLADLRKPDFVLPESVLLAGSLPRKPVLPGTQRTVLLNLQQTLAPGDYVLDLNGSLGETTLDQAVAFTIPAEETPANDPPEGEKP